MSILNYISRFGRNSARAARESEHLRILDTSILPRIAREGVQQLDRNEKISIARAFDEFRTALSQDGTTDIRIQRREFLNAASGDIRTPEARREFLTHWAEGTRALEGSPASSVRRANAAAGVQAPPPARFQNFRATERVQGQIEGELGQFRGERLFDLTPEEFRTEFRGFERFLRENDLIARQSDLGRPAYRSGQDIANALRDGKKVTQDEVNLLSRMHSRRLDTHIRAEAEASAAGPRAETGNGGGQEPPREPPRSGTGGDEPPRDPPLGPDGRPAADYSRGEIFKAKQAAEKEFRDLANQLSPLLARALSPTSVVSREQIETIRTILGPRLVSGEGRTEGLTSSNLFENLFSEANNVANDRGIIVFRGTPITEGDFKALIVQPQYARQDIPGTVADGMSVTDALKTAGSDSGTFALTMPQVGQLRDGLKKDGRWIETNNPTHVRIVDAEGNNVDLSQFKKEGESAPGRFNERGGGATPWNLEDDWKVIPAQKGDEGAFPVTPEKGIMERYLRSHPDHKITNGDFVLGVIVPQSLKRPIDNVSDVLGQIGLPNEASYVADLTKLETALRTNRQLAPSADRVLVKIDEYGLLRNAEDVPHIEGPTRHLENAVEMDTFLRDARNRVSDADLETLVRAPNRAKSPAVIEATIARNDGINTILSMYQSKGSISQTFMSEFNKQLSVLGSASDGGRMVRDAADLGRNPARELTNSKDIIAALRSGNPISHDEFTELKRFTESNMSWKGEEPAVNAGAPMTIPGRAGAMFSSALAKGSDLVKPGSRNFPTPRMRWEFENGGVAPLHVRVGSAYATNPIRMGGATAAMGALAFGTAVTTDAMFTVDNPDVNRFGMYAAGVLASDHDNTIDDYVEGLYAEMRSDPQETFAAFKKYLGVDLTAPQKKGPDGEPLEDENGNPVLEALPPARFKEALDKLNARQFTQPLHGNLEQAMRMYLTQALYGKSMAQQSAATGEGAELINQQNKETQAEIDQAAVEGAKAPPAPGPMYQYGTPGGQPASVDTGTLNGIDLSQAWDRVLGANIDLTPEQRSKFQSAFTTAAGEDGVLSAEDVSKLQTELSRGMDSSKAQNIMSSLSAAPTTP